MAPVEPITESHRLPPLDPPVTGGTHPSSLPAARSFLKSGPAPLPEPVDVVDAPVVASPEPTVGGLRAHRFAEQSPLPAVPICSQYGPHEGMRRLCALTTALQHIADTGGWGTVPARKKVLAPGDREPVMVLALRARLTASGDLANDATQMCADPTLYDDTLAQAVQRFQARHGLAIDAKIGKQTLYELNVPVAARLAQIEKNLARWHKLPADLGAQHVWVNIPEFHLSVRDGDTTALDMRVIVGKGTKQVARHELDVDRVPGLRTPVFSDLIEHVIFNPYWNVPASIVRDEVLPDLRTKPAELLADGYEVFDYSGAALDLITTDWTQVQPADIRVRQRPGPRNPLGVVKFMFPNPHNVYLHDTSARKLFERRERNFSHGCVRIEKPLEFAERLLGAQGWTREEIDKALSATTDNGAPRQQQINLQEPLPVHLVYFTAWVDDAGTPQFRRDLYQHDR